MKRHPHDDLDPARGIIWVLLGALILTVAGSVAFAICRFLGVA